MPSSSTPGSPIIDRSRAAMSASPSPSSQRLGTPTTPAIRFTRGLIFRGFMVRISLRPTKLLAPLHGSDRALPSQRELLPPGFQRDKCPLLDMTTTVTGLLCWRDFHPQEWQLASLHKNLVRLDEGEIAASREAISADRKVAAALRFTAKVVKARGHVSNPDVAEVKAAGYDDAEIMEIVAHVALNTLTNYVNEVARTDV